jgi:hypothetical protein
MEVHATGVFFQIHHQWQLARDAQTAVFLVLVSNLLNDASWHNNSTQLMYAKV